ncbi:uncharacterized protein MONOS_14296 [Monocercomonoides exilis]|uniref:uncharacterized protein n=1 Tax=Monocercomonoides exilis TaxID=2049356 RepID=UPI00355A5197|nr:hypothetical protein MONOS_14296 [Monocercomonoides exilis]|eukprot:MONOS_14296.1-p1 / transcript=MONOS_14296.1 / gene=MONOS_14296 / organism=Monocercomonoides_exilis_PA203 / gene_product=unspecified product / transcript_product=unspecified product / location=Mono_scaffold00973:17924-20752(+) / protein_length=943 / sequence_SO=supercontig / SO=protein_coding / is_pseudo=false
MTDECFMTSCKSTLSNEGGGVKVVLKDDESVLKVNGSSFSICKCSTESGRGGGLYIDGAEENVNFEDDTRIPSLNFNIVNIMFYLNEAHEGNDIFIKCYSIAKQINETLFTLNYNQESLNSDNSICGCDSEIEGIDNLIPRITYFKGLQVFLNAGGVDGRRCGAQGNPCSSINVAINHIEQGVMNAILIDGEGVVSGECVIGDLNVNSYKKSQAIVKLKSKIEKSAEKDCIMEFINESAVERCSFEFEDTFEASHSYIMKVKNGSMEIHKCEFYSSATAVEMRLNSSVVSVESGELKISETTFKDLESAGSVLLFNKESNVTIVETGISNVECEGDIVSVGGKAKVVMKIMTIENISLLSGGCAIGMNDAEQEVNVLNCSFGKCRNSVNKGSVMKIKQSKVVRVEACVLDGEKEGEIINEEVEGKEGLCEWNGSLVDIENSNVEMKEITISNSQEGGITMSGGNETIEKGKFLNNNPSIEGYPSLRRNIICSNFGTLNVMSLWGGDGWERNTSLWMLNDGCSFEGIISERDSSFFIPVLESVEAKEEANRMKLTFKGMLLVPCNLSFSVVKKKGEEKEIEKHDFDRNGFLSEREVEGSATKDLINNCGNDVEVSVHILFGNGESPSSTNSFILKNRSKTEQKGDEIISKGEDKIEWSLIAFIGCIVVIVILLFAIIIVVVIMRKKQNRGGRRVEDGNVEESKNVGRGEWRKEDIAERVEEEEREMRTLLTGETGKEMGVQSEKCKELHPYENKEIIENKFDQEEVVEVVPVNYVEIQTIASLLNSEKDGGIKSGSFTGGKDDGNLPKRDRKVKRGKRKKGKKRKHVEEDDEIGDEKEVSEIELEELGKVAADDGRNGKSTEYYIGICSAQNSHFSMIGEDSEEKVVNKVLDEAKEVVKEDKEEEREEEKPKKRKKKKKRNQKGEDKSEIVRDITEMGLLDAG